MFIPKTIGPVLFMAITVSPYFKFCICSYRKLKIKEISIAKYRLQFIARVAKLCPLVFAPLNEHFSSENDCISPAPLAQMRAEFLPALQTMILKRGERNAFVRMTSREKSLLLRVRYTEWTSPALWIHPCWNAGKSQCLCWTSGMSSTLHCLISRN